MFKRSGPEKKVFFNFSGNDESTTAVGFHGTVTVLELALENKIDISTSCGGMGTCGACRIELLDSQATCDPRNEIEEEMAEMRQFKTNERLACQINACDGMRILVPASETDQSQN